MIECGDDDLKSHLNFAPKNGTYISAPAQNELISAIGEVMLKKITAEVKRAGYFSLLADETTDFSKQEQLSVCLRYYLDDRIIERFLCLEVATEAQTSLEEA
jgi:hypothetical protein